MAAAAMMPQQYCLRWKHHHSNVQSMFAQLLEKERFCDVTLYCSPSFASQVDKADVVDPASIKGVSLRAHRVVLAACSELLGGLLALHEPLGEPVLVIDGARPEHVRALLAYMYTGEMSVHHSQLPSLLKTAEELKIKGLTDIRWSNKDEPPDRHGAITATELGTPPAPAPAPAPSPGRGEARGERADGDKCGINGGPPPLIKLPCKERPPSPPSPAAAAAPASPAIKREPYCDDDSPSPEYKRRRMASEPGSTLAGNTLAGNSLTGNTLAGRPGSDDEDRELDWRHGSLDISAERVQWGGGEDASGGSWGERGETKCEPEGDEEDWGDAPADIGSFLHTRLKVDGDNSCEDSNDGAPPSTSSSLGGGGGGGDMRMLSKVGIARAGAATVGPKSGPADPRFADVVRLSDYLRHGRRPQFWEEDYVKRVMEAIRLKELEMKQAAEILGVSYGTLYGRYRDAYGCINRPFRTGREPWAGKGAGDVLARLKRGEVPLDVAAQALGVSARDLYAHFGDAGSHDDKFEPIPIEIDPSLRLKTPAAFASAHINMNKIRKNAAAMERAVQRVLVGSLGSPGSLGSLGDDDIPASIISTGQEHSGNRWRMTPDAASPSGDPPSGPSPSPSPNSPSLLMKSRPDLTIVAARRPDARRDEANRPDQRREETNRPDQRREEVHRPDQRREEANGSS